MRILLTEGSGLTSRQVATRLAALGHDVGVVSPDPWCLARFTRTVRRIHPVPAYGEDPYGWLGATVEVVRSHGYDLLLPTQEQAAVLARAAAELDRAGVVTVVPTFEALASVQDKVSAHATLDRLGVPQPRSRVLATAADLAAWDEFPVYVKLPIGTATSGVRRIDGPAALADLVTEWSAAGAFEDGGVLAQTPVPGRLAMVQAVFRHGEVVAFHANERVREGARGGASHKCSVHLPSTAEHVRTLGSALGWHGALSLDVIQGPDGPLVIDVNPRLVEPMNAWWSGTDLVGAMVDLVEPRTPASRPSSGDAVGPPRHASPREPRDPAQGREGVRTHQLLLAVLGAAQDGRGRRGVLRELWSAVRRCGSCRDSREELTPWRGDLRTVAPVAAAAAATLVRPSAWRWFSSGSVASYAMGPQAWRRIREVPVPELPAV